jgi:hypothetical protein
MKLVVYEILFDVQHNENLIKNWVLWAVYVIKVDWFGSG